MFPKNSYFETRTPLERGIVSLPKKSADEPVLGATKKLGVVEIPVEQLENWYAILNDLHRTASDKGNDDLLEVRDQVYSYLRG